MFNDLAKTCASKAFGLCALSTAALSVAALQPVQAAQDASQMTEAELIELALSAAPPQLRENATVVGLDGTVLQEGTSGFTCMVTPGVPTGYAPMCADEVWMPWAQAWVSGDKTFDPSQSQTIGLAYMLAGDTPVTGGASNVDPFAQEPTADNQWVVEGPHIMVIVPDEALVSHLPTDPNIGGPYVMWKDTPFAHVMVPVDERFEQRQVAEQ